MANFNDVLRGTMSTLFRLGKGGPQLKANGAAIESVNAGDSGFAIHRVATPVGPDDAVTKTYADALAVPSSVRTIRVAFTEADQGGTVESAKEIPAGAYVLNTTVVITSAFNGTAPDVLVGLAADPDLLMTAAMSDLTVAEQYGNSEKVAWPGPDGVLVTVGGSGSAAAAGYVLVEYATPDV